jgi:hypothetical protein
VQQRRCTRPPCLHGNLCLNSCHECFLVSESASWWVLATVAVLAMALAAGGADAAVATLAFALSRVIQALVFCHWSYKLLSKQQVADYDSERVVCFFGSAALNADPPLPARCYMRRVRCGGDRKGGRPRCVPSVPGAHFLLRADRRRQLVRALVRASMLPCFSLLAESPPSPLPVSKSHLCPREDPAILSPAVRYHVSITPACWGWTNKMRHKLLP